MRFHAELRATGGNTTGFLVDNKLVAELGGGGRPKVVVTINGVTWRSSIARMGGEHWLGVSAERRAAAGIAAGDQLDVQVELDTAVREVETPADLAAALAAEPAAQAFWDGLSYSAKSWHVLQVTGARTAETRTRRVAKSVALLREGRAR
ncbi:YdeI/OmpD-associated family protein [Actinoplanes sp. NPDC049599]|uniref:YdeI/OmpD-associated family protein n=1 Tax=Actinoplanes sp. NPDC049599 TaxID=3363903 RepID=UPI0037B1822B